MNELPDGFKLDAKKLFYHERELGRCYREIDGYYVFWPDDAGFFDSWSLKEIAKCLDVLNKGL